MASKATSFIARKKHAVASLVGEVLFWHIHGEVKSFQAQQPSGLPSCGSNTVADGIVQIRAGMSRKKNVEVEGEETL